MLLLDHLYLSFKLNLISMGRRIIQIFVLLYLITALLAAPRYYYYYADSSEMEYSSESEDSSSCEYECYGGYGRRRKRCAFCAHAYKTSHGRSKKMKNWGYSGWWFG